MLPSGEIAGVNRPATGAAHRGRSRAAMACRSSIVGPKMTSLGEGYFITQSQRVLDEGGAEICVMRHSSIAFKPPA